MQATPSAAPYRVFIVEDSPLVRERLEALVGSITGAASAGGAAGAAEAVEAILAARPDAVVLDLALAEGSGYDVLRAVRARAPGIAVFVLSNYASAPYRRLVERLGAEAFFDKTTEFDRVRETLAARAAARIGLPGGAHA